MYLGSQVDVYTRMQNLTSEYKQFDCPGAYDTLSEIGKRKREFVCRGAEVKLYYSMCTCGVISHLYHNKLDVVERGEGDLGGNDPSARSSWRASLPPGSRGGPPQKGGGGRRPRPTTLKCKWKKKKKNNNYPSFQIFPFSFFPLCLICFFNPFYFRSLRLILSFF